MQDRQIRQPVGLQAVGQRHDNRKNHGGRAHHRGADQHRFCSGFESIARAVVLFQVLLGPLEVGRETEVLLNLRRDSGNLLDGGQLEYRLRVVRHRAVRIHGDGHRSHAQEAERHQAEREYGRRQHQRRQSVGADAVGDGHQRHHGQAQPVSAEVSGHQARKNVQRSAAFSRRRSPLPSRAPNSWR